MRRRLRHRGFRVGDSNNAFFEDEQQQKQEHIVYNHSLYNHTNDTLYNHTNFTHRNHSRLHDIIREVERERITRAEHVREEIMRREREEEIRSHDKIINLAGMGIGNGNVQPSEQYKDYAFTAYNESLRLTGKPAVTLEQYKNMTAMLPACLQMIDECQRNYSVCNASQNFCDKCESRTKQRCAATERE